MSDLRTKLREIEWNAPPELWLEIERRSMLQGSPRPAPARRWPVIVVAFALAAPALIFAVMALRPAANRFGPAGGTSPGPILYDVSSTVNLSDPENQVHGVWAVNPDGSNPTPIFDDDEIYHEGAVWSPDGKWIAFTSYDRHGTGGLFVMRSDGSDVRQLTTDFDANPPAAWSPDGATLAFEGSPEGEGGSSTMQLGIWTIDVNGGDPVMILEGDQYSAPSFSPDGASIVVTGMVPAGPESWHRSELFVANADGSDLRQITDDGGSYDGAEWSPDGAWLATDWEAPDAVLGYDVYLVRPDGSSRKRLTDWEGWDSSPIWSPDGSQIVFLSDRDADPQERAKWLTWGTGPYQQSIFVMDADGSHVHRIVQGLAFANPTSWR